MNLPNDLILGTAGHIDHGKTALVKALTGVDTDRLPAERERGISIDLGFAALEIGRIRFSVVDVPGHERFIRNMLAGATAIDMALVVIAADDGVMPQTREHLQILSLLGVKAGIIALTKVDLVDASWITLVEEDIRTVTAKTFLELAPIIHTSIVDGSGIEELKQELSRLAATLVMQPDPGPFRMSIDRVFTRPGHGTIVTGTVLSGTAVIGDELEWLSRGEQVRVRGLHRHGMPVDQIQKGTRAAVNLVGVHRAEISRGDELAEPGYLRPTRILSTQVVATNELKHRSRYRLHLGTAEVGATLSLIEGNRVLPGESTPAQLITDGPVMAVFGQTFILRQESPQTTVGGGRVLEPITRRLRRRDPEAKARLEQLASSDAQRQLLGAVESLGTSSWTELDLCRSSSVPLTQIPGQLEALRASGELVELVDGIGHQSRLTKETLAHGEARVLKAIQKLHDKNPRHSAIRRGHLKAELPDLATNRMIGPLISRLLEDGRVLGDETILALSSFRPNLTHAEIKLKADLADAFRHAGFTPPEVSELNLPKNIDKKALLELLKLLVEEEQIVNISPTIYLEIACANTMQDRVRAKLRHDGTMTMGELRDLLGTTRKYAVPFGEYLDRVGLTIRDGDLRRLKPETRELAPDDRPETA